MPAITSSRGLVAQDSQRSRWLCLAVTAVSWGLSAGAWADGQSTTCTAIISSIPYTISSPGVYCLNQNHSSSMTGGAAISVQASAVVIDLNGFGLNGLAAGPGTVAFGVHALDQKNVTIKNGTIRGFYAGILLQDSSTTYATSAGHVVHDVMAINNTWVGIYLQGRGSIIRNNIVRNTGGTTWHGPNVETAGIITLGHGTRISGNDVIDTVGVGTDLGRSIRVVQASGTLVEGNRLTSSSPATPGVGVSIEQGSTDVLVVDNRIATPSSGVYFFEGSTGKYRSNITVGTAQPYFGGTDLGNNN
jgi:hypothetical protein